RAVARGALDGAEQTLERARMPVAHDWTVWMRVDDILLDVFYDSPAEWLNSRGSDAGSRTSGPETNAISQWARSLVLGVGSADAGPIPDGRRARAAVGVPG